MPEPIQPAPDPQECAALRGRRVVVTGGTRGIGLAVARGLVVRGLEVTIVGRDRETGRAAEGELNASRSGGCARFIAADLASVRGVESLARVIREHGDTLDCLIHNAAVVLHRRTLTPDGIETQLMVNHLAPFLLTRELLPLLRRAPAPRIVITASQVERGAAIDPDRLEVAAPYSGTAVYATTKLANLLFCYALARRCGAHPTVNALHPGVVRTALLGELLVRTDESMLRSALRTLREGTGAALRRAGLRRRPVRDWALSTAEGARTTLALALSPGLECVSGCYFAELERTESSVASRDPELQERVWHASARALGMDAGWC